MLFSDAVGAIKDCWIVGDQFINQIYYTLPATNAKKRLDNKKQLYLFNQYNIKSYSTHPIKPTPICQSIARVVNVVIHGLNENRKFLPKLILMVVDWDIVKGLPQMESGIGIVLKIILNWMIKAIDRAVQTRRDALNKQKSGSTIYNEPKFLWVKMIDRQGVIDRSLAIRHKFNKTLESTIAKYYDHYIMDISYELKDAAYFSPQKELNEDGATQYWHEVVENVKDFDRRESRYLPKKHRASTYHKPSYSKRGSARHSSKKTHHSKAPRQRQTHRN